MSVIARLVLVGLLVPALFSQAPATQSASLSGQWLVEVEPSKTATMSWPVSGILTLRESADSLDGTLEWAGAPPLSVSGRRQGTALELAGPWRDGLKIDGKSLESRLQMRATLAADGTLAGDAANVGRGGSPVAIHRKWTARRTRPGDLPLATAPKSTPKKPARVDTQSLEARLERVLRRIVSEQRLPGATAAVFVNGQVVTVAAGSSNRDSRKPMQPRDRMPAGSVGKTFVAATAVALSLERRLDLDAPISRWLGNEPWFSRIPNALSLTMRLLLSHRSGIPNHVDFPEFVDAVRASTEANRPLAPLDAFKFVLDRPAAFAAGSGYLYSDSGYLLAGFVLERVLATKYESELQRRFLTPLGLASTSPANQRDLPGLVPGYLPFPNSLDMPVRTVDDTGRLVVDPSFEWTGGGLISTSSDLARWMAMLFQQDNLRPISALMTRIPDAHARYGLGLSLRDGADGPLWGHSGWYLGYRTEVAYTSAKSAGVAFQTNYAQADGGAAVDQLLAAIGAPGR